MLGGEVLREVYLVGRSSLFTESSEHPTLEVPLDPKIEETPEGLHLEASIFKNISSGKFQLKIAGKGHFEFTSKS